MGAGTPAAEAGVACAHEACPKFLVISAGFCPPDDGTTSTSACQSRLSEQRADNASELMDPVRQAQITAPPPSLEIAPCTAGGTTQIECNAS